MVSENLATVSLPKASGILNVGDYICKLFYESLSQVTNLDSSVTWSMNIFKFCPHWKWGKWRTLLLFHVESFPLYVFLNMGGYCFLMRVWKYGKVTGFTSFVHLCLLDTSQCLLCSGYINSLTGLMMSEPIFFSSLFYVLVLITSLAMPA